jgi:hypothetical protein
MSGGVLVNHFDYAKPHWTVRWITTILSVSDKIDLLCALLLDLPVIEDVPYFDSEFLNYARLETSFITAEGDIGRTIGGARMAWVYRTIDGFIVRSWFCSWNTGAGIARRFHCPDTSSVLEHLSPSIAYINIKGNGLHKLVYDMHPVDGMQKTRITFNGNVREETWPWPSDQGTKMQSRVCVDNDGKYDGIEERWFFGTNDQPLSHRYWIHGQQVTETKYRQIVLDHVQLATNIPLDLAKLTIVFLHVLIIEHERII